MSLNENKLAEMAILVDALAGSLEHLPPEDQLTIASMLLRYLVLRHFPHATREHWEKVLGILSRAPKPKEGSDEQAQTTTTPRHH